MHKTLIEHINTKLSESKQSRSDLAKQTGINRSCLSSWLNGHRQLSQKNINKLINHFNVKIKIS